LNDPKFGCLCTNAKGAKKGKVKNNRKKSGMTCAKRKSKNNGQKKVGDRKVEGEKKSVSSSLLESPGGCSCEGHEVDDVLVLVLLHFHSHNRLLLQVRSLDVSVGTCVRAAGDGVGNVSFLQPLDEIPLRGTFGLEVPWECLVCFFFQQEEQEQVGRTEGGREGGKEGRKKGQRKYQDTQGAREASKQVSSDKREQNASR
jgi:hypothetical protein